MYYSNLSGFHGMLSMAERSRDEPKTDPLTRGGYSWEFLVGVCRPVLQILTLVRTKNVVFHTRF